MISDEVVPCLGSAWVLRTEECVGGWRVYLFHLASGDMVPPRPLATRHPEQERAEMVARQERLESEWSAQVKAHRAALTAAGKCLCHAEPKKYCPTAVSL